MKNRVSQGIISQITIFGIIISLFTIMAFTPEINSAGNSINNQDLTFFAQSSRVALPVFNTGVEYIYQGEPANGNLIKTPSSPQNIVPLFTSASGFHIDYLHLNSHTYFPDNIPHKSFRQVCLLLDIPPPSSQRPA